MTLEEELFAHYKGKKVLLDTNLLLVLLTGMAGARLFARFDRVNDYTFDDYELLVWLLGKFHALMITPHILTEASNLANKLSGEYKHDWYANLALFVSSPQQGSTGIDEVWMPAKELAKMPEFVTNGITDSAVAGLASDALVITADYRLSGALRRKGTAVINFRDLRALQRAIS
jgi:rRNA-processing protein FCF1